VIQRTTQLDRRLADPHADLAYVERGQELMASAMASRRRNEVDSTTWRAIS
jgi:hypothetical protein